MSTITSFNVIPVIALVMTILLVALVSGYGRTSYKKVFILFLTISIFWSWVSLMANIDLPVEQQVLWEKSVPIFALGTAVAYAYFIAVFTGSLKNARIIAWCGSSVITFLTLMIILGHIPKEFTLVNNSIIRGQYGTWHYFIILSSFLFVGKAAHLLWQKHRITSNAEERNRIAYIFVGISLLLVSGIISSIVPEQSIAAGQSSHVINAIILTCVVIRHRLVDIKQVIKKGIVITGITLFLFDSFLVVFYDLSPVLRSYLKTWEQLAITFVVAIGLALLFNPMRTILEKYSDRLLYGRRSDYRQMVLNFANKMNHVIELPELTESLLQPIAKAVTASQVSLLFNTDSYFQTYFAERYNPREPTVSVSFHVDGPIVSWLSQNESPLYRETIMNHPEFEGLCQEERDLLEKADIELLCPITSKYRLVAILALSRKEPPGVYLQDDIDLLMTMAHEAAVVIDNAQLYAKAKERANMDELTGLLNHRYFYERLDEEIARCSRFGAIFSLVFLDIDMFKEYNDVHGHLAGDEVLAHVGKLIQGALREVDHGFRYGGDEFSILLPGTPVEGAFKLAERLRRELETTTNLRGEPLTCSLGIGSWPTDGVMRDDIIQSIDAALYYAKQTGRNSTCLACEVSLADVLKTEPRSDRQSKKAILSTIYALAATVDAKDSYTYGHSKKVSKYAADIAEAMGYSPEDIQRVRTAALLHDIGKIGVSDQILNKSGYLTDEEFEPIKAHPDIGVAILKHVDSLKSCLPGVQYHHERYNGTGYPAGLKAKNIPLDSRILAIADAYDAMTSARPYRQRQAYKEEAVEEIERCAGTQFDPEIVHVFVNLLRNEPQATKKLEKVQK